MLDYDKDNVPDKIIKKVKAIINKDQMTLEKVKNANVAISVLFYWVTGIIEYHQLLKDMTKASNLEAKVVDLDDAIKQKMEMLN